MKRLLYLSVLLTLPAFASNSVKYDFTGIVDYSDWTAGTVGEPMHGSFVLNYDTPFDPDAAKFSDGYFASYDAVTGITYEIGGNVYKQPGTWSWSVSQADNSTGVGFSDAVVTGGGEVNAFLEASGDQSGTTPDLANSRNWGQFKKKNWLLTSIESVGNTMHDMSMKGRITSVSSSQFGDAVPAPEPSSLALLGSSLLALAAFRRKCK